MTASETRCSVCGIPLARMSDAYVRVEKRMHTDRGTKTGRSMFSARFCSVCGQKFAERCAGLVEGMRP